jgi:hypothetical protein
LREVLFNDCLFLPLFGNLSGFFVHPTVQRKLLLAAGDTHEAVGVEEEALGMLTANEDGVGHAQSNFLEDVEHTEVEPKGI